MTGIAFYDLVLEITHPISSALLVRSESFEGNVRKLWTSFKLPFHVKKDKGIPGRGNIKGCPEAGRTWYVGVTASCR